MKVVLLNPGPVTLSARVRQALLGPDLCHREPEFAGLQHAIRDKLLSVYDLPANDWAAVLLTGSGTAAVEAMIAGCVPRGGHLLVIENGVYGERMRTIAERHGVAVGTASGPWLAAPDLATVDTALAATPGYTHVAVVQHETTTGRLTDLAPLAAICARYGARLLIDAVSSFGAETIDFASWPVAACAATANKCLHGVPGTGFVVCRRDAVATTPPRSVYLDLGAYLRAQDAGGTPFTQSVQTFYALDAALDEFFAEGGRAARRERYLARIGAVHATLVGLGVRPLLADGERSCVLHAYELPAACDYQRLHDALKQRGFIIYAGQGRFAQEIFRISMMGDITSDDVARLQAALVEILG